MAHSLEHTIELSDPAVRWKYKNSFADIRFGQVLEDLDIISALVAQQYVQGPVVTAALEQLDFLHPINIRKDLLCKASLNAVGKSSLEIGVRLENNANHIASAYFTFVAVDENGKPKLVTKYAPQTAEEVRREIVARLRKEHYQNSKKQQERPFSSDELGLLADTKNYSGISMYRGANVMSMYPQQTNLQGTIFGGYLMHTAMELAWDTVYEYSGERSVLASINRINFLRPVPIGALLKMHRTVCYVGNTSVQVEIVFEELYGRNPGLITNSCYFAFVGVDGQFKPKQMPKVVPATAQEERKLVEGHRRYIFHKERRTKEK